MRRADAPGRGPAPGWQSRPASNDDEVGRLQRLLDRIAPDPLFRRRLRTSVVNYYVATREGHVQRAPRPRRSMGVLGRSVLYASILLALGVSAVGAVAQGSLPGDPLYGVKLRLEEIRMQIAPPSTRNALAEVALAERTRELEQLAASGAWDQVSDAAQRVTAAEAALLGTDDGAATAPAASEAIAVLQRVLAQAPEAARSGLEHAIQTVGANHGQPTAPMPPAADPAAAPKPTHAAVPSKAPKPTHAAEPSRLPKPAHGPGWSKDPKPSHAAVPSPPGHGRD